MMRLRGEIDAKSIVLIVLQLIAYFLLVIKVLRMRYYLLNIGLPLIVAFQSCNVVPIATPLRPKVSDDINSEIRVDRNVLLLKPSEGLVYYQGKPYSGEAMDVKEDKVVGLTIYTNGKKNGVNQKWYADGTLSYRVYYENGKLHGDAFSWWKDGTKRSHSNFKKGVVSGTQTQWYQSGNIFKERILVNGKEEGLQRAWRENGKIYNNYEAVNGRIFGLKRASLCYELDNETVVYND